jgi:branched-chain amino acid transport system permease protein
MDLLLDAVVIGVLLGCFYAPSASDCPCRSACLTSPCRASGVSGAGVLRCFILNEHYGIDPLLAGC